jgi:hypothetical protein
MKTFNFKKLVKGVLVSAALVTSVVACGNKNKDNPNLNAYQMSCSNCNDILDVPFFSVQSTVQAPSAYGYASNVMRLSLSFAGQNIQMQQPQSSTNYPYYYGVASMMYVGKVSAVGTAAINYPITPGMCQQLPPGNYTVATRNVGMWNGNGQQAQVSGLQVELDFNGMQVLATLSNVWAVDLGYGVNSTHLSGNLQITHVIGRWCNAPAYYIY